MPGRAYLPADTFDRASALAFDQTASNDIWSLGFKYRADSDIAGLADYATPQPMPDDTSPSPQLQPLPASAPVIVSPRPDAMAIRQQQQSQQPAPVALPSIGDSGSASAAPGGSTSLAAAPGPAPSAAPGASGVPASMPSGDSGDLESYTRSEAQRLGIDPDKAVAVGNTEGGFSDPTRQNTGGAPAYGPYQAYIGGPSNPGLGDEMLAQGIDPRNPADARRAITYSLEHAAQNGWGAFQGAAANGIGQWDGIGQAPAQPTEIKQNLAKSSENTPSPSQPSSGWEVDQAALDDPDKWSLCGPVAAVMAAGRRGAAWTVAQAKQIAQASGLWDSGNGMHGLGTEVDLLNRMGVSARLGDANAQQLAADAQAGNTPIISTNRHYFILKGYDPSTGKFDTTTSGSVLKGGSRYLSLDEIATLGGGIQGAAYMDNPASPTPSVAAPPTAGVTPAPAGSPSASAAVAPPAADAPDPLRQQLDQSGNAGPASLKQMQPDQPPADLPYDPRADEQGPHEWRPQYGSPDYSLDDGGRAFDGAPAPGSWPGDDQNPTLPNYGQQPAPGPYVPDYTDPSQQPQAIPRTNGMQGLPPDAMYRQPLASNMGPDTTSGTDQQPMDPDQGPHEATPGSVGAGPVGPLYGPPDTPANDVPAAPTSPQAPSGFPGLQAVYDQAGNFLHWIQGAATGVAHQIAPVAPDASYLGTLEQGAANVAAGRTAGGQTPQQYLQTVTPRADTTVAPEAALRDIIDAPQNVQNVPGAANQAINETVDAARPAFQSGASELSNGQIAQGLYDLGRGTLDVANSPFTVGQQSIDALLPTMANGPISLGTAAVNLGLIHDVRALVNAGIRITPKVVAALQNGTAVADLVKLVSPGLNSAADTIDRGIGAAGSALDANAARVAAGDARSAGTVLPGTLGVVTGNPLDANAAAASRVVPPHVADTLDFPVRVPTDPGVIRAIEAAGGSVDPERGVNLHVIRQQGPEAAGQTATRSSTFYTAGRPGEASPYAVGDAVGKGVGGSERIEAPTTYRSPLVLSDAPGSAQGFDDGMRQIWPPAAQADRDAAQAAWEEARTKYPAKFDKNYSMVPSPEETAAWDRLQALDPPESRAIDQRINDARRSGPPGSPARAQALKDLVTRYGGDPAPIDDLVSLRGADHPESVWAIKENILAHNARARGYDGVLTVQTGMPDLGALADHPGVKAANAANKAAWDEYAKAQDAATEFRSRWPVGGVNAPQPPYEEEFRVMNRLSNALKARDATDAALKDAETLARKELAPSKITELADFREAANPTPATSGEAWKAAHQQVVAAADHADAMAQAMDRAEVHGTPAEWKAARKTWGDARRAYDAAVNAREALRSSEPGYTLRSDLPVRPAGDVGAADSRAAQRPQTASATAGVLPSSTRAAGALNAVTQEAGRVAAGGVGGATIGAGLPADTPEERRRNALFGAGVGMVAGPLASRLATRGAGGALASLGAIPERDSVQAAIRAAAARGDTAEVARLTSALPEGRNVALPGMEPPPARVAPNGPAQAVGDAAAQAEMRAGGSALPGMEAQAADRFAPVRGPSGDPGDAQALAEMRSGGMLQPMLVPPDPASPIAQHAAAMQTAIPPNVANAVSAAQARQARTGLSPLAWIGQLVKQVSYSSLIGPTAFVAKTGGDLSMAVGAHPKELVRALGRGAPAEYGQWAAGGLDALQYDAGPAMLDAIVGRGQYGNHGGMSLSSQTQNPVGKALATLFEGGGRLFMGVPTAVFGEAARGAGERLKAAQIATDLVRSGEIPRSSWQSTIDGLVEDARAVRAGELPSLPETHDVVQAGADYGKRQTFQSEVGTAGQVVKGIAGIEKWPRKVETTNADGETITKRLFDQPIPGVTNYLRPIFGVPWNMHARLAESSPLGLAREGVNIVRGKGTSFDHMYDAVVGSTLMAGFGYLASQGLQTGSGPSDPKQRADLIRNGWQPYSTLVNGVYVPNKLLYGMFAPSANLAGDVHDAIAYRKPGTAVVSPEVGLGILSRTGSMLRQEAFLQPLSDALSAVGTGATQSLGAGGAAALASNIDRFIPYGSTGRVFGASQDPYARQAQGGKTVDFREQVRQRALAGVGVRSAEPPALDQRGEPLPNPQQGVRALASRVSTPRAPDPILDDLQGRGVTLGPAREAFTVTGAGAPAPQNAPGSHEEALTPAEQQAWLRYRWQHIQQAYPVVTGDRRYQVLPDEAKKAAWENSILPGAAQYADAMVRHDQQQQRRAG